MFTQFTPFPTGRHIVRLIRDNCSVLYNMQACWREHTKYFFLLSFDSTVVFCGCFGPRRLCVNGKCWDVRVKQTRYKKRTALLEDDATPQFKHLKPINKSLLFMTLKFCKFGSKCKSFVTEAKCTSCHHCRSFSTWDLFGPSVMDMSGPVL